MVHTPTRMRSTLTIVIALSQIASTANAISATPYPTRWKTGNTRVDQLIENLTGEEKISLVTGATSPGSEDQAGYVMSIPRLGIPAVQLSDGEAGINIVTDATAPPSQLNVAATWSKNSAYSAGYVTGREAKILNMTIALAPRVNVLRDPIAGNFWQSYSEDPYLNSILGTEAVHGIQDQGIMANSKQIGPSSTGASAGDKNSIVDLQTLYEVYWAPHGALIDAGAATLMCSYAEVNGIPACQYPEIYKYVREQHNFTGIVMSDWLATHSTAPSLKAGLDLEMPSAIYYGQALYDQVYVYKNVSETCLDRAVGHVLLTYDKFGLLSSNHSSPLLVTHEIPEIVKTENAKLAYDIAVKSGVLLKNKGTLPLAKNCLIAVIGSNGLQYTNGAGYAERAWGFPDRRISVLDALKSRTGNTDLPSAVGVDLEGTLIPSTNLLSLNGTRGLTRNSSTGLTATDSEINFANNTALAANASYTWHGYLIAPSSGLYRISLQRELPLVNGGNNNTDYNNVASIGSLYINGSEIASGYRLLLDGGIRPWSSAITTRDGWDNIAQTIYLEAGKHEINFTLASVLQQPMSVRLAWVTPTQRETDISHAVAVAKTVKTPIVFAFAQSPAYKGMTLDAGLDELITRVAAANKNTVVVLNNAEPLLMPWLETAHAVLAMGYPNQEQGFAIADLLLGTRTPQGRLPITYPLSVASTVTRNPQYPGRVATDSGNTTFSEGLNSGYRWYHYTNTTVLFPFGYGLTYTTFSYRDLHISPPSHDGSLDQTETLVTISFTLTNTGKVAGTEVPQLYILPPSSPLSNPSIAFPSIKLGAFESVQLEAGESRSVSIPVAKGEFQSFDVENRTWVLVRGARKVVVGRNAREWVLSGEVEV
ncbi:glycoside hydrolase superfamily [Delphinella strobiligena]|nr:glycoside hydrolase superfamily [Delphinella strobiligena]